MEIMQPKDVLRDSTNTTGQENLSTETEEGASTANTMGDQGGWRNLLDSTKRPWVAFHVNWSTGPGLCTSFGVNAEPQPDAVDLFLTPPPIKTAGTSTILTATPKVKPRFPVMSEWKPGLPADPTTDTPQVSDEKRSTDSKAALTLPPPTQEPGPSTGKKNKKKKKKNNPSTTDGAPPDPTAKPTPTPTPTPALTPEEEEQLKALIKDEEELKAKLEAAEKRKKKAKQRWMKVMREYESYSVQEPKKKAALMDDFTAEMARYGPEVRAVKGAEEALEELAKKKKALIGDAEPPMKEGLDDPEAHKPEGDASELAAGCITAHGKEPEESSAPPESPITEVSVPQLEDA